MMNVAYFYLHKISNEITCHRCFHINEIQLKHYIKQYNDAYNRIHLVYLPRSCGIKFMSMTEQSPKPIIGNLRLKILLAWPKNSGSVF